MDEVHTTPSTSQTHETAPVVLVAEADRGFADTLTPYLNGTGFTVRPALNGMDAIDELAQRLPEVIILDMDSPIVSGARLLALIRENPRTHAVPVLALSTFSYRDGRGDLRAGADDFLIRPVSPDVVAAAAYDLWQTVTGWMNVHHAHVVP